MVIHCNCRYLRGANDPRCCANRLRISVSDHTTPMPPIPINWWEQVYVAPLSIPTVPDWWYEDMIGGIESEPVPAPQCGDEDMRC